MVQSMFVESTVWVFLGSFYLLFQGVVVGQMATIRDQSENRDLCEQFIPSGNVPSHLVSSRAANVDGWIQR